jgi:hypothetical protein
MEQVTPPGAAVFYGFGPGLAPREVRFSDHLTALFRSQHPGMPFFMEEKRLMAIERE